jgi:hypothetical protein
MGKRVRRKRAREVLRIYGGDYRVGLSMLPHTKRKRYRMSYSSS